MRSIFEIFNDISNELKQEKQPPKKPFIFYPTKDKFERSLAYSGWIEVEDMPDDYYREYDIKPNYIAGTNLKTILDSVPQDIKPENIIITVNFPNDYNAAVNFEYYRSDTNEEETLALFEKAKEDYKIAIKKYLDERDEYDKWIEKEKLKRIRDYLNTLEII